ncbi:hypothetical protein PAEPH01_1056 [Pancytospora epiphaga]|nr:hypothetical protein PAEPH01_1056 [Pancytospora epiphaga]
MSEEHPKTESGWDMPSEERTTTPQTNGQMGFVSKSDRNEKGQNDHDDNSDRLQRMARRGGDRPPRGDRFDDRPPRGDRFDDRPPRGDRFDDRPPRGDRFDDRPPRGDRFDDRPPRGDRYNDRPLREDRFDSYRDGDRNGYRASRGDRFDGYRSEDRREERGRYDRDFSNDSRRDDRYRRGDEYGKRGRYEDSYGYSRGDRDGWDSRRDEPYREKRRRTRQDEAEPNETLGIFALKYDIMPREFDDFLASKLEKFRDSYTTKLVVDRMTGRCKGYGFVTFDSVESAKEAKDLLTDGEILGQPFRVAFSVGERRQSGFQRREVTDADGTEEPKDEEGN